MKTHLILLTLLAAFALTPICQAISESERLKALIIQAEAAQRKAEAAEAAARQAEADARAQADRLEGIRNDLTNMGKDAQNNTNKNLAQKQQDANAAYQNARAGYIKAIKDAGGNPDDYVLPADPNVNPNEAAVSGFSANMDRFTKEANTRVGASLEAMNGGKRMNYSQDKQAILLQSIGNLVQRKSSMSAESFKQKVHDLQLKIVNLKISEGVKTDKLERQQALLQSAPDAIITTDTELYPSEL